MQFDESSPAEFIFGKLSDVRKTVYDIEQPDNSAKMELFLYVTGILYASTVLILFTFLPGIPTSRFDIGVLVGLIGVLSLVSTWKNQIQLRRYGPDLQKTHTRSVLFMVVQSFISHLILICILITSYVLLQFVEFVHPAASLIILGMIGFFVYARMISNMSLISAGLGIGLLPSFGGLSNITHNFKILYRINGDKEYHLASLRVSFWFIISGMVQFSSPLVYKVLVISVFSVLYVKWEKINGSSIIMQIRSIIHQMSPSALPSLEFTIADNLVPPEVLPNTSSTSTVITIDGKQRKIPLKRQRGRYRNAKHRKQVASIPSSKEELTPIAARSINRIASSILKETQNQSNQYIE